MAERKMVLMVEDNPGDVALVQETFVECGIDATLVPIGDAQEAVSYLAERSRAPGERLPDLVLLDLNLPVMDGRTMLRVMAAEPRWRSLPVIVFSSSHALTDREQCEALGAAYQTKPSVWSGFLDFGRELKARLDGASDARPTSTG